MSGTITNLQNMVTELLALKGQISDLNQQLKALKEREDSLKASVLIEMGGAKSMNLEGLARITRKERTHYEIRNQEALAYAMLRLMVEQGKKGLPLSEAVLLQQRVSSRALEEIISAQGLDEKQEEAYVEAAGLVKVAEPTLSITKN